MDEDFKKQLAEILVVEVSELDEDFTFADGIWDSVAIMSVAALINNKFDKVVAVKALAKCTSLRDLLALIGE